MLIKNLRAKLDDVEKLAEYASIFNTARGYRGGVEDLIEAIRNFLNEYSSEMDVWMMVEPGLDKPISDEKALWLLAVAVGKVYAVLSFKCPRGIWRAVDGGHAVYNIIASCPVCEPAIPEHYKVKEKERTG